METPERVPFRLSQNLVDGLGVTGVEGASITWYEGDPVDPDIVLGIFRIACEVALQLLRDNKDSLMNVLDSFIHDPLVEWEDEKRRLVCHERAWWHTPDNPAQESRQKNQGKTSIDTLAKTALNKIERKLKGIYRPDTSKDRNIIQEKEVTTGNLVQILIQEATDDANLVRWHFCVYELMFKEAFRRRCIRDGLRGTDV